MQTAKTDQAGRMPRLIWVFAGHFVGFVMRRPMSDFPTFCTCAIFCRWEYKIWGFEVFNVGCGPMSILMPDAKLRVFVDWGLQPTLNTKNLWLNVIITPSSPFISLLAHLSRRWAYSTGSHLASVRHHFQTTSPLKPWSQFFPYFTYSIYRWGERIIVFFVPIGQELWLLYYSFHWLIMRKVEIGNFCYFTADI